MNEYDLDRLYWKTVTSSIVNAINNRKDEDQYNEYFLPSIISLKFYGLTFVLL